MMSAISTEIFKMPNRDDGDRIIYFIEIMTLTTIHYTMV